MTEKEMICFLNSFINKKDSIIEFYEAKAVIKLLLEIYKTLKKYRKE